MGSRMLSAAKRNAPEPQVGSKIETLVIAFPERADEFRSLGSGDDVLCELLDVEVVRYQVVDWL